MNNESFERFMREMLLAIKKFAMSSSACHTTGPISPQFTIPDDSVLLAPGYLVILLGGKNFDKPLYYTIDYDLVHKYQTECKIN